MKCRGGLWRAITSTSPRNVLPNLKSAHTPGSSAFTVTAATTTIRWKSSSSSSALASAHPPHVAEAASTSLFQPMRDVMRQLPHPVVVITTLDPHHHPSSRSPTPRAMTVSSFTSLTLAPAPHVTFNVTLPSRTHRALAAYGSFNAHILSGDDLGAALADRFTRGNPREDAEGLGILAGLEEELGVQVGLGLGEVPVLRGRGVLHVLKCRYANVLAPLSFGSGERHAIVVGEVVDIVSDTAAAAGREGGALALAYADRAYRRMGEQLLCRKSETPPERCTIVGPRATHIDTVANKDED
ncbi:flavin reductase like domain-containing protein [Camillea tinctor]|nr:flavin reductase like domain-containing protein [Camillea tinctor]